MGRRDDYKAWPEVYNSRHLKRWDTQPGRQDDSKHTQRDLERAVQDHTLAQRHAGFDESAKDTHMKYERASFTVVTSSQAFRDGWEETFGTQQDGTDGSEGSTTEGTLPSQDLV